MTANANLCARANHPEAVGESSKSPTQQRCLKAEEGVGIKFPETLTLAALIIFELALIALVLTKPFGWKAKAGLSCSIACVIAAVIAISMEPGAQSCSTSLVDKACKSELDGSLKQDSAQQNSENACGLVRPSGDAMSNSCSQSQSAADDIASASLTIDQERLEGVDHHLHEDTLNVDRLASDAEVVCLPSSPREQMKEKMAVRRSVVSRRCGAADSWHDTPSATVGPPTACC